MKFPLYLMLLIASTTFAQKENPGFLGKKTVVDFGAIGHFRLINNFIRNDQHFLPKSNGTILFNEKRFFEYGGQLGISRAVSKKVMFGIQASIYRQYVAPHDVYVEVPNSGFWSAKHEIMDLNSITIAPRIEIAPEKGIMPIGFSHSLSLGYTMNKIKQRDYLINFSDYNGNYYSYVNASTDASYRKTYKEISLGYSLKSRIPITKSLLFHYSLNYHLNIPLADNVSPLEIVFNDYSTSGIEGSIYNSRMYTIFTINAGLSLAF
jgi:hypothetical protein